MIGSRVRGKGGKRAESAREAAGPRFTQGPHTTRACIRAMPHDPAGGIGLSDPSSTPRRGRFRHRNGDVIASPAQVCMKCSDRAPKLASPCVHACQRSPGTLSPDGSHLYPVEVQSDTAGGRYVASHWHLPRDTGSRARYVVRCGKSWSMQKEHCSAHTSLLTQTIIFHLCRALWEDDLRMAAELARTSKIFLCTPR